MRKNLPVTQNEYDYDPAEMIVSATDLKGRIVYANETFIRVSGYSWDELVGKAHNMVRHPDVPPAAFQDLWDTIARGDPWTGIVKNRRKNGDHYWVVANVIPLVEDGRVTGYLSVRTRPTREQVDAAAKLYAGMNGGSRRFAIRGGEVWRTGPAGWLQRVARLSIATRAGIAFFGIAAAASLPALGLLPPAGASGIALALAALATWQFHARIARPIAETIGIATRLAGCDLRPQPVATGTDEIGRMRRALVQLNVNLLAVMGDVRSAAHSVSRVSTEISQGGDDLSSRSEEQASSLEETAASMEEIAATAQQSDGSVTQAARLVVEASKVATEGSDAMRRVVSTMDAISASSGRISEIISVIDGIAFQTNLLALNAAVEAARAGEQGRGFAVVASEVRALAQRSAQAAREVKTLITDSVNGVTTGTAEVNEAGRTIGRIVDSVNEVRLVLEGITGAIAEQRSGISQVNDAVTQLDLVVQQNAALAEQSAAAAHSLKDEAGGVIRTLGLFKGIADR